MESQPQNPEFWINPEKITHKSHNWTAGKTEVDVSY